MKERYDCRKRGIEGKEGFKEGRDCRNVRIAEKERTTGNEGLQKKRGLQEMKD